VLALRSSMRHKLATTAFAPRRWTSAGNPSISRPSSPTAPAIAVSQADSVTRSMPAKSSCRKVTSGICDPSPSSSQERRMFPGRSEKCVPRCSSPVDVAVRAGGGLLQARLGEEGVGPGGTGQRSTAHAVRAAARVVAVGHRSVDDAAQLGPHAGQCGLSADRPRHAEGDQRPLKDSTRVDAKQPAGQLARGWEKHPRRTLTKGHAGRLCCNLRRAPGNSASRIDPNSEASNIVHQGGFMKGIDQLSPGTGRMALAIGCLGLALTACTSTDPKLGGSPSVVTGAAGGATAANANSQLEHCDASMGTLAIVEDQSAPWYTYYYSQYRNLGSTVPVLRMMIQQSNCFVIVERGRAMANMMQERALSQSGEMRAGSNFGKGQMAAADYTMSPTIQFNQNGSGGTVAAAGLGRAFGGIGGAVLAAGAGSMKSNEAGTTLIMIDNRSGVQLAAAEGSAKNFDFGFFGSAFTAGLGGGASGYSNTPEGKIIVAAFADSYNQLVKAVKNYKAQTVQGGLGNGGTLGVQGGSTPASQAVDAPAKKKPAPKKPTTGQ